MSTSSVSSVVFSAIPLVAGAAAAVPLARGAMTRWRGQRAGRAYELAEDYRPVILRAAASALTLVTGIVLAFTLPGESRAPQTETHPSAVARAAPAPPPPHRPGPGPRSRPHPLAAASATPAAASDTPSTEGSPAGGTLQRFADGTRVWLPPQYTYPSAARRTFPLVVAYVPDTAADREQLFTAFARHVAAGKADPFLLVLPPDCAADPEAAATLADRYYRTVSGVRARGVLGVGALAPCAVREALTRPGGFGAYAGVAGTYGPAAPTLPTAAPDPAPDLALTVGGLEAPQRAATLRLRTALRALGIRVRLIDGVLADPSLGGGQRLHELALAAQYFTEELAAPGGVARIGMKR